MDYVYPALLGVLAAITCASAIAMVVTQNIVRAALWLLFALCGTAGLFFLLGADFVGATQLLVYVGGTLVLVVFGVMLTAQGPFINLKIGAGEWAIAACVGIAFYTMLALTLFNFHTPHPERGMSAAGDENMPVMSPSITLGEALLGFEKADRTGPITGLGEATIPAPQPMGMGAPRPVGDPNRPKMLRQNVKDQRTKMSYLLPFEIVSVHLLVVLIGAAYLARSKRRRGGVA